MDDDQERTQGEPWLSELLDAAAEQYEPDAERLKAMVTARIAQQSYEAEPTVTSSRATRKARRSAASASPSSASSSRRSDRNRGRGRGLRLGLIGRLGLAGIPAGVALTTIGAAAALAVGATATIAVTSSHDHHTVTIAAPSSTPGQGGPASQNTGTADASGSPATASNGTTKPSATSSSGATSHPSPSSSESGSTTSSTLLAATPAIDNGSNSDWAQLDLTVDVKDPLTALHVTVKVSKCAGLSSTGLWDSGAIGQFTTTATTDSDGSITYEFELVRGDQVSPGTVTFAVQFDHAATGWNVADDTYYVAARTATSTSASSVQGAYQG